MAQKFQTKERLQILAAGANSGFWKALRDQLLELKVNAIETLVFEPPENLAKITEYQQMARLADLIIRTVDGAKEELQIMEDQAHG